MNSVIQTDQRTCFDENGAQIPCEGTGQDGEIRYGRPWPMPRFSSQDDLVKDLLNGITWTRDVGVFEFPLTWYEAQGRIEEMNQNRIFGYDDWRLPHRNALFDIVSHAHVNPALPAAHPFVNVFTGYYWTGTSCARLPNQAWYVHLGGARVQRGTKQGSYMVWPVRGGNGAKVDVAKDSRFHCGGKTVLDRWTGLTWLKDADVMSRPVAWKDALAGAEAVNCSGSYAGGDWRLPNIRELAGLLDMKRHSPALACNHPFIHLRPAYWSATTSIYDPRYAWVVEFRDGAVGVAFKQLPEFHAWYVRGNRKGVKAE